MSQIQQQEEENNTIDTKLKDKLGAEMYEVVKALAIILGFKTFEDYVAHCIKQNAEMFIEGEDLISDYFCDSYQHLVRGPSQRGLRQTVQGRCKVSLFHRYGFYQVKVRWDGDSLLPFFIFKIRPL